MSDPYVALTWPKACAAGAEAAEGAAAALRETGWRMRLAEPGLMVWERPERPLPGLARDEGAVIVGRRVCDVRTPEAPLARWSHGGSVTARAQALSRGGWGAYVAVLHDPAADRWWVFRDPSGAREAYAWRRDPLAILSSGLEGLPPGFGPPRIGLDWGMIADLLRNPGLRGGRPALAGLEWVSPGDLQPVDGAPADAVAIWRPAQWARYAAEAAPDAPRRLQETLVRTVAALGAPYERLVSEASGGLDSSIVNAAIGRAGLAEKVVAALHYVGDRPEADERRWAGELCARWGLPLASVDRVRLTLDLDEDFGALARDVRPPFAALDSARDRDTAERLQGWEAQALVTGKGGDALFFQMPTPLVLADLWQARGWAALRDPLNADVARWLRRSVWAAWRDAARTDASSASAAPLARFAGPALGARPPSPPHPWLADLDDVPPAKRVQIRALTSGQVTQGAHRRSRAVEMLHPLLTQPMLEVGLSIPTWELVRGGRDRALARDAFSEWLPPSVARRRSKGGLHSWYARLVAANAPALRRHLVDGVLADAGLLDRTAMARALDPDDLIRSGDGVDLMAAVAVESWVRHWQTRIPDAPGAERPRW